MNTDFKSDDTLKQTNPFQLRSLLELFFQPKRFFSRVPHYPKWSILFSAYLLGVFSVMDRIDQKLLRADFESSASSPFIMQVVSSWVMYWAMMLVLGVISAAIVWLIYGWWFKKRLQFSGAKNADITLARQVFVLQALIYVLPSLLITLAHTFLYPNYLVAYNESMIATSVILFIFWSCWTSYRGATTVFVTNKWAIVWFLILPVIFYLLVMGVFVYLASSFQ